jgi:hypothetical protein
MTNKKLTLTAIVSLIIATTAHAGWIYLYPDFNWFGYRDRSGVLHAWQADEARYNNVTRDYQVEINGHWLSVGQDVYQLTGD